MYSHQNDSGLNIIYINGGAAIKPKVLSEHFDDICDHLEQKWNSSLRFSFNRNHNHAFCQPIQKD